MIKRHRGNLKDGCLRTLGFLLWGRHSAHQLVTEPLPLVLDITIPVHDTSYQCVSMCEPKGSSRCSWGINLVLQKLTEILVKVLLSFFLIFEETEARKIS